MNKIGFMWCSGPVSFAEIHAEIDSVVYYCEKHANEVKEIQK